MMTEQRPHIIVIAGPNGSGKSTTAPSLLKGTLGVTEFVNADVIAEGLSAASRTFAPWIDELKQTGYIFHLVFLWLPNAEFAIARVAERVRLGGHNVPEETVRRRYNKGMKNFFQIYRPLADTWRLYNNSDPSGPVLIASGEKKIKEKVYRPDIWGIIRGENYE